MLRVCRAFLQFDLRNGALRKKCAHAYVQLVYVLRYVLCRPGV